MLVVELVAKSGIVHRCCLTADITQLTAQLLWLEVAVAVHHAAFLPYSWVLLG